VPVILSLSSVVVFALSSSRPSGCILCSSMLVWSDCCLPESTYVVYLLWLLFVDLSAACVHVQSYLISCRLSRVLLPGYPPRRSDNRKRGKRNEV